MVSLQVEMFNLCMGHFKTYMKPRQGLFSTFKWDIPKFFKKKLDKNERSIYFLV